MLPSKRIIMAGVALACLASGAHASFLDTDFWCRTYGCVVVHDGDNYDIYDNYQFATQTCCVPVGQQMIDFYIRAGNTNVTGEIGGNGVIGPNDDESMLFGITQDGSTINASLLDDGDGYLDAGDAFSFFTLNPNTDILLDGKGRSYSHSFFISSRNTRFSMRALATLNDAKGDFAQTLQLGDIKLTPSFSESGNDQGFQFGSRANTANIQIVSGVDDLGDLTGQPTQIMNFGRRQGIRQRNGDIDTQTIRLDFLYEMPEYDLSMGTGSLNVDVAFDFYRED
ncbi:hypothetical protein [Litorimonas sp. WD9-15]|uniref:hypothetical protein n=1 Tax=Litorimonas sp. WD9-15 TaxID=3418716 RepID=UPI003D08A732